MNAPDPSDRFRRLAARFSEVLEALPPQAWSLSSPCEEWTVRDVVRHVIETERDLLNRMSFGPTVQANESGDDPAAGWQQIRLAMQTALDDPSSAGHTYDGYFGPTTFAETVDTFYSLDLLVHAWDIARGAGLGEFESLDPDDVARARVLLEPMGDTIRMSGIFGAAIEVGDAASDQDRFLAWTGRRP